MSLVTSEGCIFGYRFDFADTRATIYMFFEQVDEPTQEKKPASSPA